MLSAHGSPIRSSGMIVCTIATRVRGRAGEAIPTKMVDARSAVQIERCEVGVLHYQKDRLVRHATVGQRGCAAAGFALNYSPFPNWLSYSSLLELARILTTELQDLEPPRRRRKLCRRPVLHDGLRPKCRQDTKQARRGT